MTRKIILITIILSIYQTGFPQIIERFSDDCRSGFFADSLATPNSRKYYLLYCDGYKTIITSDLAKFTSFERLIRPIQISPEGDTLYLPLENVTVSMKFDVTYSGAIFVENWDSTIVLNKDELKNGNVDFEISRIVFSTNTYPVKVWVTSPDEFHFSYVGEITRTEPILGYVRLLRKPFSRVNIWVDEAKSEIEGTLKSEDLFSKGMKMKDVTIVNGFFSELIDHPSDLRVQIHFQSSELDTSVAFQIEPQKTEQTFYIYSGNIIERLKRDDKFRRAKEARQKQLALEKQRREEEEKRTRGEQEERALALSKQTAVRVQVVGEYLRRRPKSSFTQQLQRPESNFSSFPQVSTFFDIENFVGSTVHLRTQISALALSGIGLGVSVSPVVNLIPNKGGFCVNAYLGGSLSFQGANLDSHVNGFRTGFLGVRLGFGRPVSKLDPGVFMLDARGSLQGIPFINDQNEFKVETVDEFRLGGELAINKKIGSVTLGSIAFQYGIDNLFDSNFSFGLKFY